MTKRNKFWTVIFACLPGAGHMFMGFMKMGLSLMLLFFGWFAVSSFLRLEALYFIVPVIWFYAFFDCINKAFCSDETFAALEDHYVFEKYMQNKPSFDLGNKKKLVGTCAILLGVYLLIQNVLSMVTRYVNIYDNDVLYNLVYMVRDFLPQGIIAGVIIVIGARLIMGKKRELDDDEA